jgi:hypothetical protein
MRILEYDKLWTFTSTGAGAWQDAYTAAQHTFNIETAAGSTATVLLEHRRQGSSLVTIFESTSVNLAASSHVSRSYSGAYYQVRPHVTDMTSTGTVYVQGLGN